MRTLSRKRQTQKDVKMKSKLWTAAVLISLLTAFPADAEIIKGVMAIKGAEMS